MPADCAHDRIAVRPSLYTQCDGELPIALAAEPLDTEDAQCRRTDTRQ